MKSTKGLLGIALAVTCCAARIAPQAAAQGPAGGAPGAAAPQVRGRGGSAYPIRPPADPAVVARGKQIFGVNCAFCHGSDARGGEGGPNLVRSQLVLDDQNGELIIPVVQNGRADQGMPMFGLGAQDITAIATFIHSIRVTSAPEVVPASGILVGDAKAGEAYFSGPGKCNLCHSVTGDLAGIAAKYDPRTLQNKLVFPTARGLGAPAVKIANIPPTTVTVTPPTGQKVDGTLDAIDDFLISLTDSSGNHLTYRRNGDVPKVEIHDPLQAHRAMLGTITDNDVHNLTAYLETLK